MHVSHITLLKLMLVNMKYYISFKFIGLKLINLSNY